MAVGFCACLFDLSLDMTETSVSLRITFPVSLKAWQWKSKYGGMEASDSKRLRELEEENWRFKQISADLLLENRARKAVIAKSCNAGGQARTGGNAATRAWTSERRTCAAVNLRRRKSPVSPGHFVVSF